MKYTPARGYNWFSNAIPVMTNNYMKTDISEKDGQFILDIDLPGYKKEDIKIALYNGDLTISAERSENKEEKDTKGNIIRAERYSGSCSRSWFIGRGITEEEVKAKYENGILTVSFPSEERKQETAKKEIQIL